MTKITYIPGEIANAAIDEHGNRKPVTRTHHIFDDAKGKKQSEVNEELEEAVGTVDEKITAEKTRAEGVEGGLNTRLQTVEQLAEISIGGGDAQIATGADFTNPDATKRAKVTTVGAVLDGADSEPTAGSEKLVKSGGAYAALNGIEIHSTSANYADYPTNLPAGKYKVIAKIDSSASYNDTTLSFKNGSTVVLSFDIYKGTEEYDIELSSDIDAIRMSGLLTSVNILGANTLKYDVTNLNNKINNLTITGASANYSDIKLQFPIKQGVYQIKVELPSGQNDTTITFKNKNSEAISQPTTFTTSNNTQLIVIAGDAKYIRFSGVGAIVDISSFINDYSKEAFDSIRTQLIALGNSLSVKTYTYNITGNDSSHKNYELPITLPAGLYQVETEFPSGVTETTIVFRNVSNQNVSTPLNFSPTNNINLIEVTDDAKYIRFFGNNVKVSVDRFINEYTKEYINRLQNEIINITPYDESITATDTSYANYELPRELKAGIYQIELSFLPAYHDAVVTFRNASNENVSTPTNITDTDNIKLIEVTGTAKYIRLSNKVTARIQSKNSLYVKSSFEKKDVQIDNINLKEYYKLLGYDNVEHTIYVGENEDYTTIQDAVASITDASPSNKYNIIVLEGEYDLSDANIDEIRIKAWVNIIGISKDKCKIVFSSDTQTVEKNIFDIAQSTFANGGISLIAGFTCFTHNIKGCAHIDDDTWKGKVIFKDLIATADTTESYPNQQYTDIYTQISASIGLFNFAQYAGQHIVIDNVITNGYMYTHTYTGDMTVDDLTIDGGSFEVYNSVCKFLQYSVSGGERVRKTCIFENNKCLFVRITYNEHRAISWYELNSVKLNNKCGFIVGDYKQYGVSDLQSLWRDYMHGYPYFDPNIHQMVLNNTGGAFNTGDLVKFTNDETEIVAGTLGDYDAVVCYPIADGEFGVVQSGGNKEAFLAYINSHSYETGE